MLLCSETSGPSYAESDLSRAVYFTTDTCLIPDLAYALDPPTVIAPVCRLPWCGQFVTLSGQVTSEHNTVLRI